MAERRREVVADIPLLISTQEVEALAVQVLQSGLLPATADGDAAHIALATAYGMDILLTWNCRHIANAAIVGRPRRLALEAGYTLPEIYTPEELLGT